MPKNMKKKLIVTHPGHEHGPPLKILYISIPTDPRENI